MKNKQHVTISPNAKISPLLNEVFFTYNVTRASLRVKEILNDAISKYGITGFEFVIMYVLSKKKSVSQKDLGTELGIDKASMVKFLDNLQDENYIKRTEDQNDRRIKFVSLTTKGASSVVKLQAMMIKIEDDFLAAKLTQSESKTLKALLRKLMNPLPVD